MLPSCKEVAEQISENMDQPLTGTRWLKMKMHLLVCAYCRRYSKQLEISSQTIATLEGQAKPNEAVRAEVEKTFKDLHCNHSNKH